MLNRMASNTKKILKIKVKLDKAWCYYILIYLNKQFSVKGVYTSQDIQTHLDKNASLEEKEKKKQDEL